MGQRKSLGSWAASGWESPRDGAVRGCEFSGDGGGFYTVDGLATTFSAMTTTRLCGGSSNTNDITGTTIGHPQVISL